MKRICIILTFFLANHLVKADDYTESFNVVSENYVEWNDDIEIIRSINGGSVIVPLFDESCPTELKGPFAYACKILEEYLPPCLPLQVRVSCGKVNSSSTMAISKVRARSKENFGISSSRNSPMSTIKGVILGELSYGSTATYLEYVPDLAFLNGLPDIEITYNSQKLNEFSFSLEPNPGTKYDFISVALRDLLIGLGISSSYRYNPITHELDKPSQEMTPFECAINESLGYEEDSATRLANATKGKLILQPIAGREKVELYAPISWTNGVSLNYFIPQSDCSISKILSYDFGKGTVTRSLNDTYAGWFFKELLGWRENFITGIGGSSSISAGSTSLLVPYRGEIQLSSLRLHTSAISLPSVLMRNNTFLNAEGGELQTYVQSFHPFLTDNGNYRREGTSIALLKKDGSWDLVFFSPILYGEEFQLNMNDWTFHYSNNEYARTVDGYLKARVTTSELNMYGGYYYKSTFFVVDYLPQQINLSFSLSSSGSGTRPAASGQSQNVRLYFSNLEGINRVVLERLREGAKIPTKAEIQNYKEGFYDTTIDRKTTFTVVGYNNNGTTRSLPVIVEPIQSATDYKFERSGNVISISGIDGSLNEMNYVISSIGNNRTQILGKTVNQIDISRLPKGLYVLSIEDTNHGMRESFKFRK